MFSVLHPAPSVCIDLDLVDNDGHVFCMGKLPADLSGDNEPANPLPDPCPLSSPDLPCQRLPGEPRARALEFRAGKILQQALGPTKADLVQLFRMLPPQFVRHACSGRGIASPPHAMHELHAGTAVFHEGSDQVPRTPTCQSCVHYFRDPCRVPPRSP